MYHCKLFIVLKTIYCVVRGGILARKMLSKKQADVSFVMSEMLRIEYKNTFL